jgi:hypothetical protein
MNQEVLIANGKDSQGSLFVVMQEARQRFTKFGLDKSSHQSTVREYTGNQNSPCQPLWDPGIEKTPRVDLGPEAQPEICERHR